MSDVDDINKRYAKGRTLLMLSAAGTREGNPKDVRTLLEAERIAGSMVGVDVVDDFGNAAMHYAYMGISTCSLEIAQRKAEIIKDLVRYGASPFEPNYKGECAIDWLTDEAAYELGLPKKSAFRVSFKGQEARFG